MVVSDIAVVNSFVKKEVFKILNGHVNIDRNIFSQFRNVVEPQDTRYHLCRCTLDIKRYSFSQIQEWNIIHTDCVTANSVNMLKTKLTNISRRWDTH